MITDKMVDVAMHAYLQAIANTGPTGMFEAWRAALEAAERARAEDWEAYAIWTATNTYSPAPDAK